MKPVFDREKSFFSALNYQQLLSLETRAADDLALRNQQYVAKNDQLFEQRLQLMLTDCQQNTVQNLLQWQHLQGISELKQQLSSMQVPCLLALFHLGPHRDLLPDLAAAGIPFSAPIAGLVYQQFYQHKDLAPTLFGHCFELLAVDDPRIGRQLLQRVRAGRYLAIYVDGNMGPDGVHCKEGSTTVQFGPVKIRAKAGTARLAAQLVLPILPLFCHSDGNAAIVNSGPMLAPPTSDDTAIQHCMQQLYAQLFIQIQQRPEQWEYAACLQRWRETSDMASQALAPLKPSDESHLKTSLSRFRLSPNQIRLFQQQQQNFLVHCGRGKAIELPEILLPHLHSLTTGFTVSAAMTAQLEPLLQAGYLELCYD